MPRPGEFELIERFTRPFTRGEGVRVGARSALLGGNHVGHGCELGEDVCLHPNVVVYANSQIGHRVTIHAGTVIGSDGYGYVLDEGRHRKVLQEGNVILHDDVEIGANAAIDRAALGATVIGAGTKIDNLVHVADNVVMGRHCLVMGQAGIAGQDPERHGGEGKAQGLQRQQPLQGRQQRIERCQSVEQPGSMVGEQVQISRLAAHRCQPPADQPDPLIKEAQVEGIALQ